MISELWPIYATFAFVSLAVAADLGHAWISKRRRPDSLAEHYAEQVRHEQSFMSRHKHEVQG